MTWTTGPEVVVMPTEEARANQSTAEIGDRVTDAEQNGGDRAAMRVLRLPGERAREHEIEAIPGSPSVAAVNDEYPADDAVLVVAFENGLNRHVPEWPNLPAAELAERFERAGGTLYSYPQSRCEAVPEKWEPADVDGRTSGAREREQVFGDHPEAVEAFINDARRLFTEPNRTAADLLELLSVGPPATETVANADAVLADLATPPLREATVAPRSVDVGSPTRGKCRYSSDDEFKPEDPEAIVCWHCSGRPSNRPEKFSRDEQAGAECEQVGTAAWDLRRIVAESVDLSGLPEPLSESYVNEPRRLLNNLAVLRSGDEDRIRKTALRLAYKPHLDAVEDYNYQRALALLCDRGEAADLPIIGDGSYSRNEDAEIVTDGGTEQSGKCRNCGERFNKSREELGECPGCGAGLANPAGFMPEDMDLAAAEHHRRIVRGVTDGQGDDGA